MNETQLVIAVGYGLLFLIVTAGLAILIRSTRSGQDKAPPPHDVLARLENRWGYLVAAMLVALLALTIFQVPYDDTSAGASGQKVKVGAAQFAWVVQPGTVQAGRPVEFAITSRDVQHGFGVYEGSKLVFQVQVPAEGQSEQRYVHTFTKPGDYTILCMEFCGFQHHLMRGKLTVE
jgi:cytochrome c oxidase subunit II